MGSWPTTTAGRSAASRGAPKGYSGAGKRIKWQNQAQADAQFKKDYRLFLKKFEKETQNSVAVALGKIGRNEADNMKKRLLRSPHGESRKVGREGKPQFALDFQGGEASDFPILQIGVDDVMGEGRAEMINFSQMILTGRKEAAPLGSGTNSLFRWNRASSVSQEILSRGFAYGGNWGSGSSRGDLKLKVGKVHGKKLDPDPEFFDRGIENVIKAIKKDVPDALRDAMLIANSKCPWESG